MRASSSDGGMEHYLYGISRSLWILDTDLAFEAWAQAWINNRASFYITRAFLGFAEGGFIPGVILFSTYFYTSRELATRLAIFWSTLNVGADSSNIRSIWTDVG